MNICKKILPSLLTISCVGSIIPCYVSCSKQPIVEYHYHGNMFDWKPLVQPYQGPIKKSELTQFYFEKIKEDPNILINDLCFWYLLPFDFDIDIYGEAKFDISIYNIDAKNYNLSYLAYIRFPSKTTWYREYYNKYINFRYVARFVEGTTLSPHFKPDDCFDHPNDLWYEKQYWETEFWGRLGPHVGLGGWSANSNSATHTIEYVLHSIFDADYSFRSYYLTEAEIIDD